MKDLKQTPPFLPEDYDKESPGIEDMKLDATQEYWLHHDQKAKEDGIALGEYMSAEYDSYIVIGFKKEKLNDHAIDEHGLVCGAYHIDNSDFDTTYEIGRLLGHYAFQNPDVAKILNKAISWRNSLAKEQFNPEPPEHEALPRDRRFHLNRYNRILSEETEKLRIQFIDACGNYKLRRNMRMKMVLTAIADQLNDNEPVEIDFFCNFVLMDHSDGDNVSGIDVQLRKVPCSWNEADSNRIRFVELCKQYNVTCHIVWLED